MLWTQEEDYRKISEHVHKRTTLHPTQQYDSSAAGTGEQQCVCKIEQVSLKFQEEISVQLGQLASIKQCRQQFTEHLMQEAWGTYSGRDCRVHRDTTRCLRQILGVERLCYEQKLRKAFKVMEKSYSS